MNPYPVTPWKISRNITTIKDGIPDSFDRIVDYLIEKEVLQLNVKQDLSAIHKTSEKIDFLLHRLTRQGEKACGVFVTAMERNGLRTQADIIRQTREATSRVSPERMSRGTTCSKQSSRDEMQYSIEESSPRRSTTAHVHVPRLDLPRAQDDSHEARSKNKELDLEDKFRELMIQNETFREDLRKDVEQKFKNEQDELRTQRDDLQKEKDKIKKERKKMKEQRRDMETKFNSQRDEIRKEKDDLLKEKDNIRKERRRMRKENEALQKVNNELKEKVHALENEIRNYREKSDKQLLNKDKEIENLRTQNNQLRRDLENLKERVCAETDFHQDQTLQILQKVEEVDGEAEERDSHLSHLEEISKTTPHNPRSSTDRRRQTPNPSTSTAREINPRSHRTSTARARDPPSPRATTARGIRFSQKSPLPDIDAARNRERSSMKSAKTQRWQPNF